MKNIFKRFLSIFLALSMVLGFSPSLGFAATPSDDKVTDEEKVTKIDYEIHNPYEKVEWGKWDQYKANFHTHSTNSDGGNLTSEMVEDHYEKGYDILAMTDHNYVTRGWENADKGPVTEKRKREIESGVGRDGKGMLDFSYSNEQSKTDHINTFGLDWNNGDKPTMDSTLAKADEMNAIAHINHMGRYTGYKNGSQVSSNQEEILKYVNLLRDHDNTVGVEIVNKIDNESRYDRILWDNILMNLMPEGRNVWGFSNDDTHSLNATGYSFNMMLMPELSQEATRESMENGAFYAVSRVSRVDEINHINEETQEAQPGSGDESTLYLLDQVTPVIKEIKLDDKEDTIEITGDNFDEIEWIADGEVIAEGEKINLNDHKDKINSYVRAQLKSDTGIAYTQPFGITTHEEELNPEDSEAPEDKPSDKRIIKRVAGASRYDTAIEVSKEIYEASDTVVIATGEDFPDSLTASVIASENDAPLLLSSDKQINKVKSEISRLKAKEIIIVGGENSVSKAEEESYMELSETRRIAGSNRYETSLKIAEEILKNNPNKKAVIVASGTKYPDALSISPYAAREKSPILLADGDKLPGAEKLVKDYSISEAIIAGGEDSVGKLEKYFTNIQRISGKDRYETAINIAEKFFNQAEKISLVSGENFPDALAVSPLAAKENMPLILTPGQNKSKAVEKYISENSIKQINIFGGEQSVSDDLFK